MEPERMIIDNQPYLRIPGDSGAYLRIMDEQEGYIKVVAPEAISVGEGCIDAVLTCCLSKTEGHRIQTLSLPAVGYYEFNKNTFLNGKIIDVNSWAGKMGADEIGDITAGVHIMPKLDSVYKALGVFLFKKGSASKTSP